MGVVDICVVLLALIALVVFIGLCRKKNMWFWIVTYWCVLTVKNCLDGMNSGVFESIWQYIVK